MRRPREPSYRVTVHMDHSPAGKIFVPAPALSLKATVVVVDPWIAATAFPAPNPERASTEPVPVTSVWKFPTRLRHGVVLSHVPSVKHVCKSALANQARARSAKGGAGAGATPSTSLRRYSDASRSSSSLSARSHTSTSATANAEVSPEYVWPVEKSLIPSAKLEPCPVLTFALELTRAPSAKTLCRNGAFVPHITSQSFLSGVATLCVANIVSVTNPESRTNATPRNPNAELALP
mmetsp:Transcript_685/g.2793  ORF Transcript_685/g.2793 Transcript_685/m.2793 type:complete len:236 (+) Transcript_685:371-1078(+)